MNHQQSKQQIFIFLNKGVFLFFLKKQIYPFCFIILEQKFHNMSETNGKMAIIQESHITSKSTTMTKLFNIDNIPCQYKNTNTVRIQEDSNEPPKLVISNFLCKQQGQTLKKVTEIKYGAKTILLTDEYTLQVPEHSLIFSEGDMNQRQEYSERISMDREKKTKKKQFFKKKPIGSKFERIKCRRDTKNIVKNFVKTFYKFCEQRKIENCIQLLKNMMNSKHYNNSMVQNIANHQELAPNFEKFLTTESQEWIEKSKIRDKEAHKQAVNIYLKLLNRSKNKSSPLPSTQNNTNQQNQRSSIEKGSGSE